MKVEIGWQWLAFTFKEQLVLSYIKIYMCMYILVFQTLSTEGRVCRKYT